MNQLKPHSNPLNTKPLRLGLTGMAASEAWQPLFEGRGHLASRDQAIHRIRGTPESFIQQIAAGRRFDLLVIGRSAVEIVKPRSVHVLLDACRAKPITYPVVELCDSWLEGQANFRKSASATQDPIQISRVYLHQWLPLFLAFKARHTNSANEATITWPSGDSDSIRTAAEAMHVVVSTQLRMTFEFYSDLIEFLGGTTAWHEQSLWSSIRQTAPAVAAPRRRTSEHRQRKSKDRTQPSSLPQLLLVDGNSWTDAFAKHVATVQRAYLDVPIICALGYPRWQEIQQARLAANAEILSKPFSVTQIAETIRAARTI